MASLHEVEIRRILRHLRQQTDDKEVLARFEDELRSQFGEEFLREPDLLVYFSNLYDEFISGGVQWKLKVIPHAHLRMIQRGIHLSEITSLFSYFIRRCQIDGQRIATGPYRIIRSSDSGTAQITVRADIDHIEEKQGQAHVVTVFWGYGGTADSSEVNLE